jgi:signal peptidase II
MLLGGGMGNLIDRIFFGKVFDFIDLHIKNLHWPAFNVADIAITLALFLLIFRTLKVRNVLS